MRKKRALAAVLALGCLLALMGCGRGTVFIPPQRTVDGDYGLAAAVLYAGGEGTWQDTLDALRQSTLVGLRAAALDVAGGCDLAPYDLVYVDGSILNAPQAADIAQAVMDYTRAGGTAVLANELCPLFDLSYLGAKALVKVTDCPVTLDFPPLGEDLADIQGLIRDFASLYPSYGAYETLKDCDYGWALDLGGAAALARWQGYGLYTVNAWGDGLVFLLNPLLPSAYSVGGFSMEPRSQAVASFASTTASCGQLLLSAIAEYRCLLDRGYALSRVFGSYGSPSMAWELHYEEITGIAHDSLDIFTGLCQENLQIPSYTLIRNSYTWFLRAETATYYLGGEDGYHLDLRENAYSSGTHIDCGGDWLRLGQLEDAGSYFVDYPAYTLRAYPALVDLNGDGNLDLICGGQDGQYHYFRGLGFDGRLKMAAPVLLTDPDGQALSVGELSAPTLADLNGDGNLDLVSGSAWGGLYWFAGNGTLCFEPRGVLLKTDQSGQTLPAAGDLDGDGVCDLALGSDGGILRVFYGAVEDGQLRFDHSRMDAYSHRCANAGLGAFLAPYIGDTDGDGDAELAIGTFDGYVAIFEDPDSQTPRFLGADEWNYKGNARLKTGAYCVPAFGDLDGDGVTDLLCGSQEYGLAYPIDDEHFPYAAALRAQVEYAQARDIYIGLHFYTNAYASPQREAYELAAHQAALRFYGLDPAGMGVNQHTWYTSTLSPAQSLHSAWKAGLLWNSGFAPEGAAFASPQVAAENVISLPFFLMDGDARTLLVQNCAVLPYCMGAWSDLAGKYEMPVCVYYHCDFVYESDQDARRSIEALGGFQDKFHYNFTSEDQLMSASAAAYHLTCQVSGSLAEGLTLTAGAVETAHPLCDPRYQAAVGLKLRFRADVSLAGLSVDADVWRLNGRTLYLGLNRPVTLALNGGGAEKNHLSRVNLPADIAISGGGADIAFLDGGMLQAAVAGKASALSPGWTVTERDGETIFTKFGGGETLRLRFDEEGA